MQPESGRIVYAGSDFPNPIRFRSSQEGPDHIVHTRPHDLLFYSIIVTIYSRAHSSYRPQLTAIRLTPFMMTSQLFYVYNYNYG